MTPEAPPPPPLQFQNAEFATPPTTRPCGVCRKPIAGEYFEARGHALCATCAGQLKAKKGAFPRAFAYGAGAAILGTLVWFAVIKLFEIELGLIAIGVGVLVGMAVRKGSGGVGGRKYQALAMALTYVSITASYVPFVLKGLYEGAQKTAHEKADTAKKTGDGSDPEAKPQDQAPATDATAHRPKLSVLSLLAFVAIVFGLAFASPFLGGASNIMGIIIIGIALYEAWKLTRGVPVTGPFRLAPAPAVPEAPAAE
jgi:hypothetical protein